MLLKVPHYAISPDCLCLPSLKMRRGNHREKFNQTNKADFDPLTFSSNLPDFFFGGGRFLAGGRRSPTLSGFFLSAVRWRE